MKKILIIKKAFTLIELLVVTTIIVIISSSWIFYFLDFVQDQEISQKIYIIEDNLDNLDKKIDNYEIFDYQLEFNTTNTWKLLYITYINNFDSNNQIINITNINWDWEIISKPNTWSWKIKIYKKNKLFLNNNINRVDKFEFNFYDSESYKITWTLSWKILNEIKLNYFSENNLFPEKNDILELIKISDTINWLDIWNIIINNIWWKKIIKKWLVEYNEIYLFFENNWKEKYIKIKNI